MTNSAVTVLIVPGTREVRKKEKKKKGEKHSLDSAENAESKRSHILKDPKTEHVTN